MKNHFMPVWGFLLRYKRPCRTLYKRLPFPKRLRYASGMLQNSLTKLLGVQIILMFVATPHSSSSMSSSYCCIEVKMPHNSLHRLFGQQKGKILAPTYNITVHGKVGNKHSIFRAASLWIFNCSRCAPLNYSGERYPTKNTWWLLTICSSPFVVKIHVRWKPPKTCHNPGLICSATTCPISALSHIISGLSST